MTQHRTDPRLGPLGLSFLDLGLTAEETINALVSSTPHHGWRQLAVIDAHGGRRTFRGTTFTPSMLALQVGTAWRLPTRCAPRRCPQPWCTRSRLRPISRWLSAFAPRCGREEMFKEVTSAGLLVVHEHAFPYVDLRVDDHPDPIAEITRLWVLYAPVSDNYLKRVLEPDSPEANVLSVGYLTAEEARVVLANERPGTLRAHCSCSCWAPRRRPPFAGHGRKAPPSAEATATPRGKRRMPL